MCTVSAHQASPCPVIPTSRLRLRGIAPDPAAAEAAAAAAGKSLHPALRSETHFPRRRESGGFRTPRSRLQRPAARPAPGHAVASRYVTRCRKCSCVHGGGASPDGSACGSACSCPSSAGSGPALRGRLRRRGGVSPRAGPRSAAPWRWWRPPPLSCKP